MNLWNDTHIPPCSVSEFLLGEVDSSTLLAVPPGDPSQSMENLYGPGSEGSPPTAEESEEGECLWGWEPQGRGGGHWD